MKCESVRISKTVYVPGTLQFIKFRPTHTSTGLHSDPAVDTIRIIMQRDEVICLSSRSIK